MEKIQLEGNGQRCVIWRTASTVEDRTYLLAGYESTTHQYFFVNVNNRQKVVNIKKKSTLRVEQRVEAIEAKGSSSLFHVLPRDI